MMWKYYIVAAVSVSAIVSYLAGYFICAKTNYWEIGGALYVYGLLWFYVAWVLGIIQVIVGLVQYFRRSEWSHHVIAGFLVLACEAAMLGFGAAGLYLSA